MESSLFQPSAVTHFNKSHSFQESNNSLLLKNKRINSLDANHTSDTYKKRLKRCSGVIQRLDINLATLRLSLHSERVPWRDFREENDLRGNRLQGLPPDPGVPFASSKLGFSPKFLAKTQSRKVALEEMSPSDDQPQRKLALIERSL